MTSRDIVANTFSNITIQNKTGKTMTIYGLYINQFADNTPSPHDCTAPNVLYAASYLSPYTSDSNANVGAKRSAAQRKSAY